MLTQLPVGPPRPRLILVEDDIFLTAPAKAAPWLAVWSLHHSRLMSILPAAEAQKEVEPQVALSQHRGRGEVIPCYEFRAVRNAVLTLLPACKAPLASGSANVLAHCVAPGEKALGLLFYSGELGFVRRPEVDPVAAAPAEGVTTPEAARLLVERRVRLNLPDRDSEALKALGLWRSFGAWLSWKRGNEASMRTPSL